MAPRTFALLVVLAYAATARAVLLRDGDGTQHTTAPPDDPGFSNVGFTGSTPGKGNGVVYVGNGWILTVDHVGVQNSDVTLAGVTYRYVPGTNRRWVELPNIRDFHMYRVHPRPPLPPLRLATTPATAGDHVVMIGPGFDRGAGIENGFLWDVASGSRRMRWGANRFSRINPNGSTFQTTFDAIGAEEGVEGECQATTHDSGGAVFSRDAEGRFVLAGLMSGIVGRHTPPAAWFGDRTTGPLVAPHAAELERVIAISECADGADNDRDGKADDLDPECRGAAEGPDDPGRLEAPARRGGADR